ncbi:response regulator transcription factor [Niabella ginsengisoli]|uniref:Response regulator n=1 Tax=Niabella ginsengisoli TaxID=522298 RepID=A0ABS9SKN8_9BACT|nr:response regulator [Niabella ginsengisoli]MCH5598851.1 response regulator [Niabella ginsengisoli]
MLHAKTKKIIFVEDDYAILDVASFIFEKAGYCLAIFGTAKSMLNSNFLDADIFILDKQLPDIDGVDLCRLLKADSRIMHVPVLMLSANPQINMLAPEAGADGVLEKPFEIKELLSIIEQLTS